jgi:hypothetical protein
LAAKGAAAMTRNEAREILLLYRPGSRDTEDPAIRAALDLARSDPELAKWLEEYSAEQEAMRRKFREIPVPAGLKDRLLAERKLIRPPQWWWRPAAISAAAAIVLLLGVWAVFREGPAPDRFVHFQERMAGTALRDYSMDVETADMRQLREFIAEGGAPADYEVPERLQKLQLTGGGVLKWRSNPVGMVCFDRGDKQMLFLFVMERAALKDPPPEDPVVRKVNELSTASWSRADKVYFLAGPEEAEFARKYL